MVRRLTGTDSSRDGVGAGGEGEPRPAPTDDEASRGLASKAEELREQRQRAKDIFEQHIPLLEKRQQTLESRAKQIEASQDAEEMSALLRLRGMGGVPPLSKYKK